MAKVTVCMNWMDACAGCEMSFLDIDERIVELLKYVDLLSTPITDLKHPPVTGCDVGILSGAVSDSHQEEVAREMRERCKTLIALGDCAVTGGICTMRNFFPLQQVLDRAYVESESNVAGQKAPNAPEIAKLHQQVKALDQIVKVDVYLPGCPPSADAIWYVLTELLAGRTPAVTDKYLKYD